jgi:hypothetical protein
LLITRKTIVRDPVYLIAVVADLGIPDVSGRPLPDNPREENANVSRAHARVA